MLDAHCHLDLYGDPSRTALNAKAAGVFVVCVTNLPSAFLAAQPHTRQFKKVRLALGLHPLSAESHTDEELSHFRKLVDQTSFIGEVGVDFSRDGLATRGRQLASFRFALQCLDRKPKFVTIHSRRAEAAVLEVLAEEYPHPLVFHWYSGDLKNLKLVIERGHSFSINPAMVVNGKGREIVSRLPRERVLTESDGPFINIGDRTIVPKDVKVVEDALAEMWSTEPSAVRISVAENFRQLIKSLREYECVKDG
jgi:TatD DNase family protein